MPPFFGGKKAAPRKRTRLSPEQQKLRRREKFLSSLEKSNPNLYAQIMMREVLGESATMGAQAASGRGERDDLEQKLIDMALASIGEAPTDKLGDTLKLMETVLQFSNALPRQDSPAWQNILAEGLRNAPAMMAAMAQVSAASRGQLVQAAPLPQVERPALAAPAERPPSAAALPAADVVPSTTPEEAAPMPDPVAALVAQVIPLLDLPPTEAAARLVDIMAEAERSESPALPLANGLLFSPLEQVLPMLRLAQLSPQYGALAKRLLAPAGQTWLREVQAEFYRLTQGDEDEPEEAAAATEG